MDKKIDVAKIMAEITCEAEKRYGKVDANTESGIDITFDGCDIGVDVKRRNHAIYENVQRIRSFDGIQWRTSNYEHQKAIFRLPMKLLAKVVSKLTRFIMYQQNIVNMTAAANTEMLQQSVLNLAEWSQEIERQIIRLNEKTKQLKAESPDFREALYLKFEEKHRGSEAEIEKRLQFYVDNYVKKEISPQSVGLIVDLGCGRGEWLSLLKKNGYHGIGVDMNESSLQCCELKGIKNYCMDVTAYLRTLPAESVKLLTSFQLVEHLEMGELISLFEEVSRVLRKDGMIIMETPNPANLNVGAHTFYMDPTHKRPIPSELLKFIAEENELENVEIAFWQQEQIDEWWDSVWRNDSSGIEASDKYRAMEGEFKKGIWCSADYALIARK